MGLFLSLFLAVSLLTGTPMGSSPSVVYPSGNSSTTENTFAAAFDGDLSTFFASYDRTYTWCGLDLGSKHIIRRVGWSPRNDGVGPNRVVLGVFEGANRPDFLDAIPLYMITTPGTIGVISSDTVTVSRGFRYVRYVGPNDARCNIAEVQFWGEEGAGDDSHLTLPAGIPYVSVHTLGSVDPLDKVNDIPCWASVVWEDGLVYDTATVRLRGNASMQFPKKPYRLKFDKKKNLIGSPAKAKKWCLLNNYGDKTLLRNPVAMDYSRRLGQAYTSWMELVEVYFNGEYKGVYQLADQVEIDKNKINITVVDSTDVTGGYHLEMDGYASEEPYHGWFQARNFGITIKEPDAEEITNEQYNYIRSHYLGMENAAFSHGNWRALLDERTFINHFLIGELTGNTDTWWSCHMYKKAGCDTIFVGPEWDFDIAFDNDIRHYPTCNQSDYLYKSAGSNSAFVTAIVGEMATKTNMKKQWSVARMHRGLNPDTICALVDEQADYIREAATRNFLRWPILNQNVHMNPRNSGTYQGEVDFLKNYIRNRFTWMDNHVGLDRTVPVPSDLNHNGHIDLPTPTEVATKHIQSSHLLIHRNNRDYNILGF